MVETERVQQLIHADPTQIDEPEQEQDAAFPHFLFNRDQQKDVADESRRSSEPGHPRFRLEEKENQIHIPEGQTLTTWTSESAISAGRKEEYASSVSRDVESILQSQPKSEVRSSHRFFDKEEEEKKMMKWIAEQERKLQVNIKIGKLATRCV